MRIEVLIGSEEPVIFPLKSSKVTLGSSETCDITVETSGISRKHIIITSENDQYFIIDQGSTNGTFINEERLIPGKRVEFTSFFPVRLGDNVLISLLSEDEADSGDFSIPFPKEKTSPGINVSERSDSTTVINLNELRNVKTEKLVLERNQKRETRRKTQPQTKVVVKAKGKINYIQYLAILIIGGAAYFNFVLMEKNADKTTVEEIGKVITPSSIRDQAVVSNDLIPKDELPSREALAGLINDIKCTTDIEKYFCELMKSSSDQFYGVVQVGLTFNILVDGKQYYEEATKYVKKPKDTNTEELRIYEETVQRAALYAFLMRKMPLIDMSKVKDHKIVVALFLSNESGRKLYKVAAIYPHIFQREKENFKEMQLKQIMNFGASALEFTDKIYRIY